jgi:hypothetical protein
MRELSQYLTPILDERLSAEPGEKILLWNKFVLQLLRYYRFTHRLLCPLYGRQGLWDGTGEGSTDIASLMLCNRAFDTGREVPVHLLLNCLSKSRVGIGVILKGLLLLLTICILVSASASSKWNCNLHFSL